LIKVLYAAIVRHILKSNKFTAGSAKKALNPEKALHFLFLAALICKKNSLGRFTEHTHYHLSPCFPLPPPPGAGVYPYLGLLFPKIQPQFW